MKFRPLLLSASVLGLVAAANASAQPSPTAANQHVCSSQEEMANRRILEKLVNTPPPTAQELLALMHPDFIQHNPELVRFFEINQVNGKAGMELLVGAMQKVGHPVGATPDIKFKHPVSLVKCDLILLLTELPLPDPRTPGKTYTAFGFDLYRIKDGKIFEHWDAARLANPAPAYAAAPFDQLIPGSGMRPPAPAQAAPKAP